MLCGGGREIGQRSCLKRRFAAAGSRNPFPLWGGAHDDGTTKELTNIAKRKESNAAERISGVQFS